MPQTAPRAASVATAPCAADPPDATPATIRTCPVRRSIRRTTDTTAGPSAWTAVGTRTPPSPADTEHGPPIADRSTWPIPADPPQPAIASRLARSDAQQAAVL